MNTTLIDFKLVLNADGSLATTTTSVNIPEFVQVMDRWKPEYEHTLTFALIMREMLRGLEDLEERVERVIE